jgi:hypothetical protein
MQVRNRLDPDYDANESLGFRAIGLGVEVCWIRREKGPGITFLPLHRWKTL